MGLLFWWEWIIFWKQIFPIPNSHSSILALLKRKVASLNSVREFEGSIYVLKLFFALHTYSLFIDVIYSAKIYKWDSYLHVLVECECFFVWLCLWPAIEACDSSIFHFGEQTFLFSVEKGKECRRWSLRMNESNVT